jgi:hypothetical protein
MDQGQVVLCAECLCASRLSEWRRVEWRAGVRQIVEGCPNPACRPGVRFEAQVRASYDRECRQIEEELRRHSRYVVDIRRAYASHFPPEPVFEGVQPTLWRFYT